MAEAAEAQLRIADIHYRQMEKPDRDFTHALRAEEEYRALILEFPDSKLVPPAKEKLRQVQEVLAEREFRIGRFYYLRESWAAAIARLQSLVDSYPLYSGADDALYLLGSAYEREVDQIRAAKFNEVAKGKLIQEFSDKAAAAYARIVSRYPVTDRAGDAKKRLEAMHRPVPTPTAEMIAQNKKEEESRGELGRMGKVMLNLHRRPDTSLAAQVGEPTLVDPKPTNAPDIVKQNSAAVVAATGTGGSGTVSVETVKPGEGPAPNQPVPRSDTQPGTPGAEPDNSGIPELRPNVAADASAAGSGAAPPPPAQINEAAGEPPSQQNTATTDAGSSSTASASSSAPSSDKPESSSKKKKKKGLEKLNPF
jgi:outer membrane protein assembly factor BamD